MLQKIKSDWSDFCIVAAPGPSLTLEVAAQCRGHKVIAVNDAYRLLPFADILYGCGALWWQVHKGCVGFAGEKWSSHCLERNNKLQTAEKYGLNLVRGADADEFSFDPDRIHYGDNGGFQAVNFGILKLGAKGRIALVGFDMRIVDGKRHFFGDHPAPLVNTSPSGGYKRWPKIFETASRSLPAWLEIVNCTPGSALTCFPMMDLADALPVAA